MVEEPTRVLWGARLADARNRAGLSRPAVARAVKVAPSSIHRYEAGGMAPRPEIRDRLSALFEMATDDLFPPVVSRAYVDRILAAATAVLPEPPHACAG